MSKERDELDAKASKYLQSWGNNSKSAGSNLKAPRGFRNAIPNKCDLLYQFMSDTGKKTMADVKAFFDDTDASRNMSVVRTLIKKGNVRYIPGYYEIIPHDERDWGSG